MSSLGQKEQPESSIPDSTPQTSANAEPPYTIFDKRQKRLIVFIVSFAATCKSRYDISLCHMFHNKLTNILVSGFASNIFFQELQTIADDLNVSLELVNLTITSHLIFQGIALSFWGPVSDLRGRRVAYSCTFLVFLGACIGLAETQNYATLIALRCLQSTGSASTIAIGSGVIGDITTRADRGGFMGSFQAGLLVPVAVGTVIGGVLASSLGWRAIFWFFTIYGGVFLVALLVLLPETLWSLVANGSLKPANPLVKFPLDVYQKTTKSSGTIEHLHQSSRQETRSMSSGYCASLAASSQLLSSSSSRSTMPSGR